MSHKGKESHHPTSVEHFVVLKIQASQYSPFPTIPEVLAEALVAKSEGGVWGCLRWAQGDNLTSYATQKTKISTQKDKNPNP